MTITPEEMKKIKQDAAGVSTETVAAAEGTQQKKVGSGEWVEELRRKWERRKSAIADNESGALFVARTDELERCIEDLRACAESSSTQQLDEKTD